MSLIDMVMNEKTNIFVQILRNNIVQITFALMGATGLALGTFITYRLSPIVESVNNLAYRVEAVEVSLENRPELMERFIRVEQKVDETNIRLDRLENKIDRLIER